MHAGIVLASGGGALGVLLGGTLPVARRASPNSARARDSAKRRTPTCCRAPSGSVWRALILWLLLMLLLTLANWAP